MAASNLVSDIFLIAINKSSDVLFFKIKPQLNISTSLNLHCLDIITGKPQAKASFKAIESASSKDGRRKMSYEVKDLFYLAPHK